MQHSSVHSSQLGLDLSTALKHFEQQAEFDSSDCGMFRPHLIFPLSYTENLDHFVLNSPVSLHMMSAFFQAACLCTVKKATKLVCVLSKGIVGIDGLSRMT